MAPPEPPLPRQTVRVNGPRLFSSSAVFLLLGSVSDAFSPVQRQLNRLTQPVSPVRLRAPPFHASVPAADESSQSVFDARLEELEAFRAEVGHADVPLKSALGRWVYTQRRRKEANTIQAAEADALDALGFRWRLDPNDVPWTEHFDRLLEYRRLHGVCNVPKKYVADPLLGAWVAQCRRVNAKLPADVRSALDDAGFDWAPPSSARCGSKFMQGFRAYRDAVASGAPVDEKWCSAQRAARDKGQLTELRIEYLDGVEFDW